MHAQKTGRGFKMVLFFKTRVILSLKEIIVANKGPFVGNEGQAQSNMPAHCLFFQIWGHKNES